MHRPTTDTRVARWALVAILAIAYPAVVAAADIQSHETVNVTPASVAINTAEDDKFIRELWDQLLTNGDREKVMASYDVVNLLGDGDDKLGPQSCREQDAALEEAMRVNPVGLAVWYIAYECAAQLGNESAAARRLQRFVALVRYGFASLPPDHGLTPIRVVSPIDIDIFVKASGQKLLSSAYDPFREEGFLPLRLTLWDAQRKRERWISFDYLDTYARLSRDNKYWSFPYFRQKTAIGLLRRFADGYPAAKGAIDIREALAQPDVSARVAILSQLAEEGNLDAAMMMANICAAPQTQHCETQAIDALLPFVEKHHATAMIALAQLYAMGRGVEQSDSAAKKLIAAAEDRLGNGWGALIFCVRWISIDPSTPPALIKPELEALARRGNPMAEMFIALYAVDAVRSTGLPLPSKAFGGLEDAARKGLPLAQDTWALALIEQGKFSDSVPWLERAAALNQASAQAYLAGIYEDGSIKGRVQKNLPKAIHWYSQAGIRGDVPSMLWMGDYYLAQEDSAENRLLAQGWFKSADQKGDIHGALGLAKVYRRGGGIADGGPADAIAIYLHLSQTRNTPAERREWANLLRRGKDVYKDLNEARRMYVIDAKNGDPDSELELGEMLISGEMGKDLVAEGLDWIRKAANQGNAIAISELAHLTYHGKEVPADFQEASRLWDVAIAKGNRHARNDFAWALCTTSDQDKVDAKRGLALMRELGDESRLPVGYIDTIGACYAASGDFKRALEKEKMALSMAQLSHSDRSEFIERAKRTIQIYESNHRQIE